MEDEDISFRELELLDRYSSSIFNIIILIILDNPFQSMIA